MWTFSTLGWPDDYKNGKKTGDLAKFHPTQVLETGYDILTLWVSRMIIMTIFALDEVPFEKVYLHGLVLDKFGKKMSKSKGNGINPLDMIEKFGTDAVRLSLLLGSTPGNNVRISEEKIENFRNFVTKLWNIYRYCSSSKEFSLIEKLEEKDIKSLSDKWIVSELNLLIDKSYLGTAGTFTTIGRYRPG
jgi:valyl-tRNA synthetase